MRDGLKIFDTDTHSSVPAEQLDQYLSPRVRELVPDLESHLRPIRIGHAGEVWTPPYRHRYHFSSPTDGWGSTKPRTLGQAEPSTEERHFQTFMGGRLPSVGGNEFADVRLKDMDEEGSDVHVIVPPGANGAENPEVELEFMRATHRWLDDFCGAAPERLKTMISASARSIEGSVEEIKRWGGSQWAVGVRPFMPPGYPIDHPDLLPIFDAAAEFDLTIVHHSGASDYPGARDMWDNPFLGRCAAHPWGAARFIGAVVGSGLMDRYPELRFALLESGFGWLPHWAVRLDDQMEYMGYVAPDLKHKPSEYIRSGRVFCSIEMHEGPQMVRMFTELMGPDMLMLGTDYPHAESRFPNSVQAVLDWEKESVDRSTLEKIVWHNGVRCFGRR